MWGFAAKILVAFSKQGEIGRAASPKTHQAAPKAQSISANFPFKRGMAGGGNGSRPPQILQLNLHAHI